MLQALARHPQRIAWFFSYLFLLDLTLPGVARAGELIPPAPKGESYAPWTMASGRRGPATGLMAKPAGPRQQAMPNHAGKRVVVAPAPDSAATGPTQPEMQSFQSVNSGNMVDLFSGDFSYNIPLMDVGGYPINIHYASGISMDQEASWCGLGWNINPGTISRNMRGLPDDFDGEDQVTKTLSMKPNKTVGVTAGADIEIVGFPLKLGVNLGVFHNTYKGWGTELSVNTGISSGIGAMGTLTAGLSLSNNSQDGLDVSPSLSDRLGSEESSTKGSVTIGTNFNSRRGINGLQMTGQMSQQVSSNFNQRTMAGAGINSYLSFSTPSYTPTITVPFTSSQYSFKAKVGSELWVTFNNFSIKGYASTQYIAPADKTQVLPAYGYLYYQNAKGNAGALLDFNREKEVTYRDKVPHIAVPIYTYDTYCITGEGTGGMFRPYRGDIGYVYDHAMASKSNSNNLSLEAGFGNLFHGGIDYDGVYASTKNNPWYGDNVLKDIIPFKNSDSTYEGVYFKNPGEKTLVNQSYYNSIGDTKLMRVDLNPLDAQNVSTYTATKTFSTFTNALADGKVDFSGGVYRRQRDKRTQVITWLKASEASAYGLDKTIKSFHVNSFPTASCNFNYDNVSRIGSGRKQNHLSEITVLNGDGRRYVYGVPVYNFMQSEVTFAVAKDKANPFTGQVKYGTGDNSVFNAQGTDNYYNQEIMPAYAHSFLLSGILSPDYVDITGDGITEDDNGEAIKFNYTRVYDSVHQFGWRAPFDSAAYTEGMKTDKRTARASYSYGTKEIWYLNSIESKTMMATFVLDTDSTRQDAFGSFDENGGKDSITKKLYRLKEIDLYAKSDYIKNGTNAKPIKTVHFEYGYDLCPGNPSSLNHQGKLTLRKLWFTYNNNNKGKLNPYVFTYHANNPAYLKAATDRWGGYKDSRNNPGQLSNADYPYTLQTGQGSSWDSTKAANDAAAWTLSKVKLPSGGEVRVTYESDDYAYVQNKRAMQLFSLAGFGHDSSSTPSTNLYTPKTSGSDYQYVFINITDPVATKADIQRKYLDGVTELYFKLLVNMPGDRWGSGSEFVPFYAEIDNNTYGIKSGSSGTIIWIKLKVLDDGAPPAVAALQFLRLNLPSKAYPMSEPGDDVDVVDVIKTLLSAGSNIAQAVKGFGGASRNSNLCNVIVPSESFIRLDNPVFKKFGGGLRVKKVEVYDNFNHMSHAQQQDALYGQEYDYSTTALINNVPTRISSGVASYEPVIGGEENPFHVPIEVTEKIAPLAPTNYTYTEEPLGETYFPGPSVGYSKVTVRSTNKDKKSATGLDETQFYTTYDFPTLVEYTPLDNQSKKTYNPGLANFLHFAARHDVTLSQGFKVELNDMNGKIKSQASYPQNDTANPISYTYNYYNVVNENTLQKKLSGTVMVADSANGGVTASAELGKDVEVMVDLREQTSSTISASVQANLEVFWILVPLPPFVIPCYVPSLIPAGSSEVNRYRSIAVMKVVNRYGILDSVIHIEKGSKVSTKNMVYDGETGEVVLSRTNNEYDDPIYNFVYPAHWAYSGMGPAYKNARASWSTVYFRQGRLFDKYMQPFNTGNNFESGDELWMTTPPQRIPAAVDTCSPMFYLYKGMPASKPIWAIDAAKGKEGNKGIFFIDKDGIPVSSGSASIQITRSGKRNMPSTPVGSITSLQNPLKTVSGGLHFVFDSTTQVVTAGAAAFKDFWRVDSSLYRKDTVFIVGKMAGIDSASIIPVDYFTLDDQRKNGHDVAFNPIYPPPYFRNYSQDNGGSGTDHQHKSWMLFDFTDPNNGVPANSVVTKANLYLYSAANIFNMPPHQNLRNSNESYLRRSEGAWIGNYLTQPGYFKYFFSETNLGKTDVTSEALIPATTHGISMYRNDTVSVPDMVQGMVDDLYSNSNRATAMILGLVDPTGTTFGTGWNSQLIYNNKSYNGHLSGWEPRLNINYCKPCSNNTKPVYATTPIPGYYCYSEPRDSFICKPNIVDSAVNPYRWGILGDWRMYRAYTYYDVRQQANPAVATNIRKDGAIKGFAPYWNFGTGFLTASVDTNRWVWNSEMTLFNRKGYEIENHDPLNRYNSGQYGYNQTMPVAAAQNAQNREMFFDGMEDYNYKTDTCLSCGTPRFINLQGGGTMVDTISHTGRYSLRVGGNQSDTALVKIASYTQDTVAASLSIRLDSSYKITTTVTGTGTGLPGTYINEANKQTCLLRTDTTINFNWGGGGPAGCPSDLFAIIWDGKIQPRYTDQYIFYCDRDDGIQMWIEDTLVMSQQSPWGKVNSANRPVTLTAGKLYHIHIEYNEVYGNAYVNMQWASVSGLQPLELLPKSQLYPLSATDASVASTIHNDTTLFCYIQRAPKPTRVTLDRFSPLQGRQMVLSAWVKEEQACVPGSYTNSQVVVSFTGSATSFTLAPTGRIIEGWQRVEDTLTIPASATAMKLTFKSTNGSVPAYFDDIRMHPFNTNIKSFVYDPINLRLMAELDENNYATFYEYDDDGTLVRLKKETERGIKTIKETRSALLKD